MSDNGTQDSGSSVRLLIIGLVSVAIVIGLVLVVATVVDSSSPEAGEEKVNVLANSDDECVVCHSRTTPGIVDQYGHSSMAAAEVSCQDCHEVKEGYPGSSEHEGTFVLASPSTAMCEDCHTTEVAQFEQSRHGLLTAASDARLYRLHS